MGGGRVNDLGVFPSEKIVKNVVLRLFVVRVGSSAVFLEILIVIKECTCQQCKAYRT